MPYNFAADRVFTQRNFVADFLQAKCIFNGNRPFCFFEAPLGDLGATYDDHLRFIGKRVVDILLALIKLFSLGITAEELRAIVGWKSAISLQRGSVDPQFQVERVAPPTNHSSSQKTRINVLSYGIKIWTDLSSVLLWITRVTDGQTDRILLAIPRLHYMQRGKTLFDLIWFRSVKS